MPVPDYLTAAPCEHGVELDMCDTYECAQELNRLEEVYAAVKASVVRHGDHTHHLAPAHEDPDRGYAARRTRTLCRIPLAPDAMPLLPVGTAVTCPRCTRLSSKET